MIRTKNDRMKLHIDTKLSFVLFIATLIIFQLHNCSSRSMQTNGVHFAFAYGFPRVVYVVCIIFAPVKWLPSMKIATVAQYL